MARMQAESTCKILTLLVNFLQLLVNKIED
jgi:hypothetical protein